MKVTIKDIARLADVSTATVSKVVNGKDEKISAATRARVMDIIETSGYVPNRIASSMVTKKTKTLGLIIPDITNPFFPELARGVEDVANKEGYTLILCNSDNSLEKEDAYIDMLQEKMVDGIIFTASSSRTEVGTALKRVRIPVITVDRDIDGHKSQRKIVVDNEDGAFEAVTYMLERGYHKIYHISGPMTSKPAQQRYRGYLRAHEEKGLTPPSGHLLSGTYTGEWGVQGVNKLVEHQVDFDGIFCGNDLIALGALKALHHHGVDVPNTVGLIGYDDIYMAQMVSPELTTVKQPNYEMGYQAGKLLIGMIQGDNDTPALSPLKTHLIVRGTTR